ncbi:type II toxin-antitoxin system RelB/DinJ family antitoxin [Salmonella enterica subsp. enterica]|nr:type II toxin-antitoxin system RelB/DinJ family antitoxin [Salmonella enterica subsp. enterica serovar Wagenia]
MATINARIDDETKVQADRVLKRIGISHTQAISALYQYIADCGRLPFQIITQVKTPADIQKELFSQLKRSHYLLNILIDKIEKNENLNDKENVRVLNGIHEIYRDVWNRIPLAEDVPSLEALATAMQKCTMIFMDFKHFGYGSTDFKVLPDEYSEFTAAVGRFEHLLEAFTSAPARYSETKGSQE